jgi:exonuclease III
MHILYWNCRELGKFQRKRLLKDYILDHHIDIVAIKETKLESLPSRTLNFISTYILN